MKTGFLQFIDDEHFRVKVGFFKVEKICQDLLFARNLEIDAKTESLFNTLEKFYNEKEFPLNNIITDTTYDAPVMVERYKSLTVYFKIKNPGKLAAR